MWVQFNSNLTLIYNIGILHCYSMCNTLYCLVFSEIAKTEYNINKYLFISVKWPVGIMFLQA